MEGHRCQGHAQEHGVEAVHRVPARRTRRSRCTAWGGSPTSTTPTTSTTCYAAVAATTTRTGRTTTFLTGPDDQRAGRGGRRRSLRGLQRDGRHPERPGDAGRTRSTGTPTPTSSRATCKGTSRTRWRRPRTCGPSRSSSTESRTLVSRLRSSSWGVAPHRAAPPPSPPVSAGVGPLLADGACDDCAARESRGVTAPVCPGR